MTNEQLVKLIKQGENDELIPLLWEKVKKLVYQLTDRHYNAFSELWQRNGFNMWDLRQHGYNAFLKAIQGYDEAKGYKFTSYLKYPIKNLAQKLMTDDLLNSAESLDKIIYNNDGDNDTNYIDMIVDERASDFVEQIEAESVYYIMRKAVQELPDKERYVINEHYFNERSLSNIAVELDTTVATIHSLEQRAIKILRKHKDLHKLEDIYGFSSHLMYSNGNFKSTGISNVERIAINRADIKNKLKADNSRTERL